jgi:hypothetical protein
MKKRKAPLGMRPPKTYPTTGKLNNKPKMSSNKGMAIAQAVKS